MFFRVIAVSTKTDCWQTLGGAVVQLGNIKYEYVLVKAGPSAFNL